MRQRFNTQRAQAASAFKRAAKKTRGVRSQPAEKFTGDQTLKRGTAGRWYVVTPAGEWRRAPDEPAAQAELYARRCETAEVAGEEQPRWQDRLTQLVQEFNAKP